MTKPRMVLRGATYLVTRRCVNRQYLLRPGIITNQVFEYALARAATAYGIKLHAYAVMSNHCHLVLTDPRAQLPEFQRMLDCVVARALNALHGRRDYFWSAGSYHAEVVATPADALRCAVYTLLNPVAAGLVRKGRHWPGLWSKPRDIGTTRKVARPAHFFSPGNERNKEAELRLSPPPGFASAEAYRGQLEEAVRLREREEATKRRTVVGAKRVMALDPCASPSTKEPLRAPRPKVAAQDPDLKRTLLQRLQGFLAGYVEALELWRNRKRRVEFPEGTYWMRVAHGASCAGAG